MTKITFYGAVTARCRDDDGRLLTVCCAAKATRKQWRVISLESGDVEAGLALEPGIPVKGEAALLNTYEGSILARFRELNALTKAYGGPPRPRDYRAIRLAGEKFYKFRLYPTAFNERLPWREENFPFSKPPLPLAVGTSTANLTGHGVYFSGTSAKCFEKTLFSELYERRETKNGGAPRPRSF